MQVLLFLERQHSVSGLCFEAFVCVCASKAKLLDLEEVRRGRGRDDICFLTMYTHKKRVCGPRAPSLYVQVFLNLDEAGRGRGNGDGWTEDMEWTRQLDVGWDLHVVRKHAGNLMRRFDSSKLSVSAAVVDVIQLCCHT
jgi:hypothetical protein